MQVDSLARGLRGYQYLNLTFAELLFGLEASSRFVPRARLHAAVDTPNAETPRFQAIDEVVQGVLEFREQQQSLTGILEEPLPPAPSHRRLAVRGERSEGERRAAVADHEHRRDLERRRVDALLQVRNGEPARLAEPGHEEPGAGGGRGHDQDPSDHRGALHGRSASRSE